MYDTREEEVMILSERVAEAQRSAQLEIKDLENKKKSKKRKKAVGDDFDDGEAFDGVRDRIGGKKGKKFKKK